MRDSFVRFTFATILLGALIPTVLARPKIGVLLKTRNPYWGAVEKGALAAGEKFGAEVIVKSPLSESDVSVQIQMLHALTSQGVSAIVIAPCAKDALTAPLAAATALGIKVVVIDSPVGGAEPAVFIATDNHAAGIEAGRLLGSLVSDNDEVALLKHIQNSGATGEREAGALVGFREVHAKAAVHGEFYASTEKDSERAKAELLLATYPNVKAILASGTLGTMAMLHVLEEKKSPGAIKLIGFGFNLNPEVATAINNGAMYGWIAQLPQEMGGRGVASALALVKGEAVTPIVHTDFIIVTKANLKQPNVQALLSL